MALGSHLITVRRLEKYINDVIGKKANLPDTSKTIIGNISQINSDLTNNTCTNLLNPTAQTQTINGVTFTNNGDGTYTVNGTASAQAYVILNNRFDLIPFRGKSLRIVGCPSGGTNAYQFNINIYDTPGNLLGSHIDYGEGVSFEVPTNASKSALVIAVKNGQTVNNLLFKPMITTDLNATYNDYVPYTGDSGRLNEDVAQINSDLTPNYFQLSPPSNSLVTIEYQDNWRQGNRIHIAFTAISSADMPRENAWAIVPNEHRGRGTRQCGFVHIDGISDMRINSIMVDGVESGNIYQRLNSSVPANTRVTFIGDYFI